MIYHSCYIELSKLFHRFVKKMRQSTFLSQEPIMKHIAFKHLTIFFIKKVFGSAGFCQPHSNCPQHIPHTLKQNFCLFPVFLRTRKCIDNLFLLAFNETKQNSHINNSDYLIVKIEVHAKGGTFCGIQNTQSVK